MQLTYIADDAALQQLLIDCQDSDVVVVDTEFMRTDTFYPRAALLQLCFDCAPDMAWLVDPVTIADFSPLARMFHDPSIIKVVHSPSEDLEVFQLLIGQQPLPLFDTQRAAAFVGLGFGMGYQALVQAVTGVLVEKGETRSNWLARPLSEKQLHYAAADVVPLLPVYRTLVEQLTGLGRLDWVLEDGAAAVAAAQALSPPPYLRVKLAWKLPLRQLALLQAVCEWREQRATTSDKPRSWILTDDLCLQIALQQPQSLQELRDIPQMPAGLVQRQGELLLSLVSAASALDDNQLPAALPQPLDASQRQTLKKLKQAAAAIASAWSIEAPALLGAKDYELMVRLGCGERAEQPERWLGWRRQDVIEPLLLLASVKLESV